MERITATRRYGYAVCKENVPEALDRLGEYEDIGLTPFEIANMLKEYEILTATQKPGSASGGIAELRFLPCPFCGGEAETYGECDMVRVVCTVCGANTSGWFDEAEDTATDWNRRTTARPTPSSNLYPAGANTRSPKQKQMSKSTWHMYSRRTTEQSNSERGMQDEVQGWG